MSPKRSTGLPSKKQIRDFISTSDQPAGKREIARAFGLWPGQNGAQTLLKHGEEG